MTTGTTDAPIQRDSFASTDADEVTDYIARMYVGNQTTFGRVHGSGGFSAAYVQAGALATDRVQCSIDYSGSTEPWDFFCSFVMRRGTAHVAATVEEVWCRPGDSMVYPVGVGIAFDMADAAADVVRFPLGRLDQAAEALAVPTGQLRLKGMTPVSPAMARYWRYLVGLVNGALMDEHSPAASPLVREELTRMAALAALQVFPSTAMTQQHTDGPGRVGPATVRRAVAHIDAHAEEPLTLADIATAAGVGVRALQHGFRRHLDTTPLAYLRRVRLERARRELQAADPRRGDSVGAIAARWGFGKPSSFATQYRAAFGELPSWTLRT